jgi:hypothetical protein
VLVLVLQILSSHGGEDIDVGVLSSNRVDSNRGNCAHFYFNGEACSPTTVNEVEV